MVEVTPNLEQAIAEQPTAYDVDKVVEWLETNSMYVGEEIEAVVTLADAIKIVISRGVK